MDAQRDLRSANREFKRDKDANVKWSKGSRPSAGCNLDWVTGEATGGSENQRAKVRPQPRFSECNSYNPKKREHNIVKARGNYEMPHGRVREAVHAMQEAKDTNLAVSELLPRPSAIRKASVTDDFTYSFDMSVSPNRPLTLDIFVKSNGRETERFVEKEYEILDSAGEALKGRKARLNLRKGSPASKATEDAAPLVVDDFELL